jgi:cytidylate kinase
MRLNELTLTDNAISPGNKLVIAIDGPAASGKGTLAKRLAQNLDLPYLDTGLTYRAVAWILLQNNSPLDDEAIAVQAARKVDLTTLDRETLSDHQIAEAASQIAVMDGVRSALVEAQRHFANNPKGAVLDGRDIGSVVCPAADVKFYVTASPEVRAMRRHQEQLGKGKTSDFDKILSDLKNRDLRDMNRKNSPMKPAEDAHLLDTTKMDIETAFQTALHVVNSAIAARSQN